MIPLALVSREQPPGFAVISHKKTVANDHQIGRAAQPAHSALTMKSVA
jgi:hypothetical protein